MCHFVPYAQILTKTKSLILSWDHWHSSQNPEDKEGNDNPAAAKTYSETCQRSTMDFHSLTVFTKISTLDVC